MRLGLDGDRWGCRCPCPPLSARRRRGAADRVAEVIELVGAAGYAHRPIGECSGGEQQRLLIAQALVRRPDCCCSTSRSTASTCPTRRAVAALVGRICRDEGVTVVMVAHDVNPILPYLDRVVYLAGGGAVAARPKR